MRGTITVIGALACLAASAGPLAAQDNPLKKDAEDTAGRRIIVRTLTAPGEQEEGATLEVEVKVSPYWIGVQCEPVGEELKSHLQLQHGLIVRLVVDNSPAATAGLRELDVLVEVGDRKLADTTDLVDAVDQAAEQPLPLKYIRGGQAATLEIKPARRPKQVQQLRLDQLESHLKGLNIERPNVLDLDKTFFDKEGRMLFLRPGIILPKDGAGGVEVPDGVQITIDKGGDEPASITIRRGDQNWTATADSIEKLPEDLRALAKNLLGDKKPWFFWPDKMPLHNPTFHKQAKAHAEILKKRIASQLRGQQGEAAETAGNQDLEDLRREVQRLKQELKRLEQQLKEGGGP